MGTTPPKGESDYLRLGDWNAACFVCGRKGKASEMFQIPLGVPGAGGYSHSYHKNFRERQPQDLVRGIPDKMAAPWVQEPQDDYVAVCSSPSAVADIAVAECAIADNNFIPDEGPF